MLYFDIPALALLTTWTIVLEEGVEQRRKKHGYHNPWIKSVGAVAVAAYLIPGPTVHRSHDRYERAGRSFFLRGVLVGGGMLVGAAGTATLSMFAVGNPHFDGDHVLFWATAIGGLLGATTAIVVDDYLIDAHTTPMRRGLHFPLSPSLALTPHGGGLALAAAF